MKTAELRIGNWVNSIDYGEGQVIELSGKFDNVILTDKKLGDKHTYIDDILPIELTMDWLTRFGFSYKNCHPGYIGELIQNTFLWTLAENDGEFELLIKTHDPRMTISVPIKTVHQLQNVFLDTTGEELTLMP